MMWSSLGVDMLDSNALILQTAQTKTSHFDSMVVVQPTKAFREKRLTWPIESLEQRLVNATIPIFNISQDFTGNGVAIASNLILTSGHCVDGNEGIIGENTKFEVIFNGKPYNLDFKILKTPTDSLYPVMLDVIPRIGQSLQIHFEKLSKGFKPVINYVESEKTEYVTPSDKITMKTENGQSGAPRMSLNSKAVHAIHQGESEGLKVNAIYHAILYASNHIKDPQNEAAKSILSNVIFMNKDEAHKYCHYYQLETGDVDEETERGLTIDEVRNKDIFTEHVLRKHYARNRRDADAIASFYGKTVTIIKIPSQKSLTDIVNQVRNRTNKIIPTKAWHYVNGVFKYDRLNPTIGVMYEYSGGPVNHIDHVV